MDQISAYADGELNDSDKRQVDEHIAECESCSTLLDIYREISASVSESSKPVPEALRIGVMNRILYEDIPVKVGVEKQRGRFHFALTRFAPVAACLLVGLLLWQNWGDLFGGQNEILAPAAAPEPASAPAPAPAADAVPELGVRLDFDADPAEAGIQLDDALVPAEEAAAPMQVPEEQIMTGTPRSFEESARIMNYIDSAYAQISFTGELPALLAEYEPQPFGDWFGWEMVFEIPTEMVPELLAELGDRDELTLTHIDRNSTYAVVMYTP